VARGVVASLSSASGRETIGQLYTEPAAAFTARAREDIPALLAEVERLRTENDQINKALVATQLTLLQTRDEAERLRELVMTFAIIPADQAASMQEMQVKARALLRTFADQADQHQPDQS
jgi:hypothetical protein